MSNVPSERVGRVVLAPNEQLVLRALGAAGFKRSTTDICRCTRLKPEAARRTLRALSERGMVEFRADARRRLYTLTRSGRGIADQLGSPAVVPEPTTNAKLVIEAAAAQVRRLRNEWMTGTNAHARNNVYADQLASAIAAVERELRA